MSRDSITSKRRWQVRRIFILRRDTYTISEAVKLLSIPRKELAARIKRKEIDAEGDRLTWQTVAYLALEQWGVAEVEAALGDDARRVLPPLLRVEPVTVHLPAYLIRYLYHRAEESGVSIDQQLTWEVHDRIDPNEVDRLDALYGGFSDAHLFPDNG